MVLWIQDQYTKISCYILAMNNSKIKKKISYTIDSRSTKSYFILETSNCFPLYLSKIPMCSSCLLRLSDKLTPSYFSNILSSHCHSHSFCFSLLGIFSLPQVWQVCCLELLFLRQLYDLLQFFLLL